MLLSRALPWTSQYIATNAACAARRLLSSAAEPATASEDTAREFRENVREFAQKIIAPHAEHVDKTNDFPPNVNLWREMGDFGLLGQCMHGTPEDALPPAAAAC